MMRMAPPAVASARARLVHGLVRASPPFHPRPHRGCLWRRSFWNMSTARRSAEAGPQPRVPQQPQGVRRWGALVCGNANGHRRRCSDERRAHQKKHTCTNTRHDASARHARVSRMHVLCTHDYLLALTISTCRERESCACIAHPHVAHASIVGVCMHRAAGQRREREPRQEQSEQHHSPLIRRSTHWRKTFLIRRLPSMCVCMSVCV